MIPRADRGLAALNLVREQLESRLLGNDDYLALLALDRAICAFRDESGAQVLAVFQRWASSQHLDPQAGHTGDGPRQSSNLKGD